jgi:8-oxo-dGTP diphosphatase
VPRTAQLRRLNVVAGILCNAAGHILISERLEPGPFFGMWEFPGGKIAKGERPDVALARELREEIGVMVLAASEFMHLEHRYPDRHVDIRFFLVDEWQHHPVGAEGQGLRWVAPESLGVQNLLPADRPVIEALLCRLDRPTPSPSPSPPP